MPVANKHLEKAERLIERGKFEAAADELQLARQEEPGNEAIVLAQADVYLRLNKPREHRQCLASLFDKYAERSDARAWEYFRKLEKLGPVEPKRMVVMAQIIEKQKPKDANDYYTHALEALQGENPDLLLQCYQGLASLHSTSIDAHQRLADLAAKLNRPALAASTYGKLGELYRLEKKINESVAALEKAYRYSNENSTIRLALASAYSQAKRYDRVLELLGKDENTGQHQILSLLAEAYLAEGDLAKAETAYWKICISSPESLTALSNIALEYLRRQEIAAAMTLLKRLEQQMMAARQEKRLMDMAEKLSQVEHRDLPILEFQARISEQLHLDGPLERALQGMFDLYFAAGEFRKATDALERLIDIDQYAPECHTRLQKLEGKADPGTWKELAARLGKVVAPPVTEQDDAGTSAGVEEDDSEEFTAESGSGTNTLTDLILQAEIFLQYNLQEKAKERLERIAKLFPGEEERNEELKAIYEKANFTPPPAGAPAKTEVKSDEQPDWNRISEIIRNFSRQGTVKGVLSTAVNDIGRMWQASRCLVGLATPRRPPSMALEYISPGVPPSDPANLARLVMGMQQITEEKGGPFVADRVAESRQLAPLGLGAKQVQSLIAIPLRDDSQPAGVLVLEQCGSPRTWKASDSAALQAVAEQIILAVSNARLRSLMKTLAVADERSGLLHRDSYLTCLLSETERMKNQKKPLTAAILRFSVPAEANGGERNNGLADFMQQFGSSFASHLRQNDIALKYDASSLAAIMPATTGKEATFVVDKMRKLLASYSLSGNAPNVAAGIAEAVGHYEMDSADLVTELINRVESALEMAQQNGGAGTSVAAPPVLVG